MIFKLKINNIPIIGNINLDDTTYYIDINRNAYVQSKNGTYSKITDKQILQKLKLYIYPTSIDVVN